MSSSKDKHDAGIVGIAIMEGQYTSCSAQALCSDAPLVLMKIVSVVLGAKTVST